MDAVVGSIRRRKKHAKRALSLPELLVVIAVIALLLAMLIPGLNAARERVRRVFCANNLQQWGQALQLYRLDYNEFLPTEGNLNKKTVGDTIIWGHDKPGTWYNTLPLYLNIPPYKDTPGVGTAIAEMPGLHVWICPSKNLTRAYKSEPGKNQFHYGMNYVLDGLGMRKASKDTPGFKDAGTAPVHSGRFVNKPTTVFMFEIAGNSTGGTPRNVATMYQIDRRSGQRIGKFHGDYANILHVNGSVSNCITDDIVTDHDFLYGTIHWRNPRFYWGYVPD